MLLYFYSLHFSVAFFLSSLFYLLIYPTYVFIYLQSQENQESEDDTESEVCYRFDLLFQFFSVVFLVDVKCTAFHQWIKLCLLIILCVFICCTFS